MQRLTIKTIVCLLLCTVSVVAQRKDIKGQLLANGDVEGIHILNKTAPKYDISQEDGTFIIPAKVNDTLVISGLRYELKNVVVSEDDVSSGVLVVELEEKINELKPVVIGNLLTGSLESDMQNLKAKTDINFYDLGIPGSTKLPMTQNEQRLYDADGAPWGSIGLGASVNFLKLLNTISGRTKKLRAIVDLDNKEKCINRLRRDYEASIFQTDTLALNLRNEYFQFALEDPIFLSICNSSNDIIAIEYLQTKLKAYRKNRESVED